MPQFKGIMCKYQTIPVIKEKYQSHYIGNEPDIFIADRIDFPNKKIKFMVFWPGPKNDFENHVNKIVFDSRAKIGFIRKVFEKIADQRFQIEKVLIKAEMEIRYLLYFKRYIKEQMVLEPEKFIKVDFLGKVRSEINCYWTYYVALRDYYLQLPGIEKKYRSLKVAIEKKDRCFECLECRQGLKQVKHRLVCRNCQIDILMKTQKIMECPICMDSHRVEKMIMLPCGNKHYVCDECFITLANNTTKCPMCRERFV